MESTSPPRLARVLGPYTATAIVVGIVIGSGIFKKPQSIAANVPDVTHVVILWVLGGVLTFLGALATAEVAVLFPQAGGNYVYLREGYGRLAGFLWGWVEFWVIRAGSLSALATIFTESLHDILRQTLQRGEVMTFWQERFLTSAVLLILGLVNARGVRWGGGLQLFITLVKVLSLVAIIVLPMIVWNLHGDQGPETIAPVERPSFWPGLGTAFLGVLWAYHGWMGMAPIAGEIRDPQRNLPLAFLLGTGLVIVLYVGANIAYHQVIPFDAMAQLQNTTVATEFCKRLLGPVGSVLASGAVMCSVFGALNGNLLTAPRLLYVMGEDGLAPRFLQRVHPRYHTPAAAILMVAGWAMFLVLAAGFLKQNPLPMLTLGDWTFNPNPPTNKPLFDLLTDFAMFGAIIFETLALTTIFVFRRTLPEAPRSYRCPWYPLVPILYLILPACMLVNMFQSQLTESLAGLGFILVGALVYWGVYAGKGTKNAIGPAS